jgi:NAD(P)-dependent dehydrogenase (short-subunit alcohol dehydrogenase family)
VTGAARGLGQAAAVGLATYGADVAAIDLAAETCADTCREIEALGRICRTYACDVADENAVEATVSRIAKDFGRIDILVNIAGITARIPTAEIPAEQVRRLTEVNYYGTFWMCKEVGKVMLAQGSGSIVNMSALGGGFLGTGRGNAAYSSTKGAIAALTKSPSIFPTRASSWCGTTAGTATKCAVSAINGRPWRPKPRARLSRSLMCPRITPAVFRQRNGVN